MSNEDNPRDALIEDLKKTRVPVTRVRTDEDLLRCAEHTVRRYMNAPGNAESADMSGAYIIDLIQRRLKTGKPAFHEDHLMLLHRCVEAMEMQLSRERGELHINLPTARKIWDDALLPAKAAIAYHDERANDQVIDLDANAWAALKVAIQKSPRFQEMYQGGGTFTDACASVRAWLEEEEPVSSLNADGPSR